MPRKVPKEQQLSRVITLRVSECDFQKLIVNAGEIPRQKGNYLRSVLKTVIQTNDSNSNPTTK